MTDLADLRKPFPPNVVGKLPRVTQKDGAKSRCNECGGYLPPHIHLDYVGHAEVTDRLLSVDPAWNWEPFALDEHGLPFVRGGRLWIKLTVLGVTRIGVGSVLEAKPDMEKELISDAIRNAAMRFGVALDLWSKADLESQIEQPVEYASSAAHAMIRKAIDELDGTRLEFFKTWWKTCGFPPLASGQLTADQVHRVLAHLEQTTPPSPAAAAGDVSVERPGLSAEPPTGDVSEDPSAGQSNPADLLVLVPKVDRQRGITADGFHKRAAVRGSLKPAVKEAIVALVSDGRTVHAGELSPDELGRAYDCVDHAFTHPGWITELEVTT